MPTVRVDDIDMYYEMQGDGVPLVLITGLSADHTSWEEQAPVYAEEFRVVTFDNRGVGRTGKPDVPYTTRRMAGDTVGLMDRLEIERAHVAGISMGGAIAQEIAINYPDRVIGLVLHATWPKSDPYLTRTFELLKMLVSRHEEMRQVYQDLLLFTPAYYNTNQDKIKQMQEEVANSETPMPSYAFCRQADACIMHDAEDRLHLIQAPTLVAVGDRDIWTPLRFAEVLQAKIPNSRLIIEEGGPHLAIRENPGRFAEMTLSFLREL